MVKLVVLEGIKFGNRFISSYREGDDPTKLNDGTVAYKVLGIYEDTEEGMKKAQRLCGHGISREQDVENLSTYLFIQGMGTVSERECFELATTLTKDNVYE